MEKDKKPHFKPRRGYSCSGREMRKELREEKKYTKIIINKITQ